MFNPPPIPDFQALHPLVIHFPLALLLAAPLFVLLAIILQRRGTLFAVSALILMIMGTVGAWVAVASGIAAEGVVTKTDEIKPIIEEHKKLGLLSRNLFTLLSIVYTLALVLPRLFKREFPRTLSVTLHVAFLAAYMVCTLILVNTGHLGGRLVHEFEVFALFL